MTMIASQMTTSWVTSQFVGLDTSEIGRGRSLRTDPRVRPEHRVDLLLEDRRWLRPTTAEASSRSSREALAVHAAAVAGELGYTEDMSTRTWARRCHMARLACTFLDKVVATDFEIGIIN